MKATSLLFGALALTALISCDSRTYDDIAPVVTNPTYVTDVKPIISANCTSCHNPTYGETPYLRTYDEVKSAIENDGLLEEISAPSGEGMPEAGRMAQRKIDIITTWAEQGFVNE